MVIQCPECTTRFKISDDKVKPEGVKLRCAKCRHIFTVMPETAPAPVEPPADEAAAGTFSTEPAAKPPQMDTEAPAAEDLWKSGFGEPELDTAPGEQETAEDTLPTDDDLGFGFDETPAPSAEGGISPETAESPAGDDEWGTSFDASDLGLSSVDEIPADSPDSGIQLDDNWGGEPGVDTVQAAFEEGPGATGLDLEEPREEEITGDAFGFGEENIDAGSADEFEFDEEPDSGESLPVDEFAFEEEPAAEGGDGLSDFSFDESGPSEFSFDSDSTETADAFSFDKDDLFATDDEIPAEQDNNGAIDFDEPQSETPGNNDFDFDGISFGENGEGLATAAEPREMIAPAERPKPAEMPASAPEPLIEPAASMPALPKMKRKSPMSGVLRIFLILLLILGAVAGYLLWQGGTADISQLINQVTGKPEPSVPAAQIRLPLPNSFFIMNQQAGQLFVVQGEAVNGYPENRSAIAVKGMLHDDKGNVLMQQTVFCGNPLDHEDLQTATFALIEEAMNNQFGNVLSNLNVAPGKTIPYMIVFRDLPANVTEFTVEVADSKPGGQQ
ncbi:DUF3426 domain-containing protein [Trichloromonas sp.]|uniref:DUF3426 domain-containing protein n=1 Tax=Trichloromonas sp. TaxID=3069249 RepID=UPI003D819905